MAKTISTLIDDVYTLLGDANKDMVIDDQRLLELASKMASHVKDEIVDPDRSNREPGVVYVTQITSNCPRRRWYEYNHQAKGISKEKINGSNRFKFLYGDLIEESVLFLAEMAGHDVQLRQERLEMVMQRGSENYKLAGRIDAVIDGVLVDVKSMESFTFDKFKKGEYDDKWGYGNQLLSYDLMMRNDKRYTPPTQRMILGINKLNGKMHLDTLTPNATFSVSKAVADAVTPDKIRVHPQRETEKVAGCVRLSASCAYCPFKVDCYKDEGGLRVYAYSDGPKFVVGTPEKAPKAPDITEAWLSETF